MTESPEEPPRTTGPPDRQTLRLLEKHLGEDPLVEKTDFEPNAHEPRTLRAVLDLSHYSSGIEEVRLDIRWFESGDFSAHYVERQDDQQWECRWDRHPNNHNARLHFHHPPGGTPIEDLSADLTHPLDVYSTVHTAIEQRIERIWTPADSD
ncbi:Uncharacterized protein LC1Hm_0833 [Halomicrobium sp. LC1Hm]|nr:Uncharacterized protein LC1Hm_0833 [Halomicrobium sp. LC1Hm]